MKWLLVTAGLLAGGALVVARAQSQTPVEISSETVRVIISQEGAAVKEKFYARQADRWELILESGSTVRPDPSLRFDRKVINAMFRMEGVRKTHSGQGIELTLETDIGTLRKIISLRAGGLYVLVSLNVARAGRLSHLLSTYSFFPGPPDFVFSPQLRPEADDVIADHTFRSPALIMQKGGMLAALIPDIETIDGENRSSPSGADIQVQSSPSALMSFGLLPWRTRKHVYYEHTESTEVDVNPGTLAYGFQILLDAEAPARQGYRQAVRFLWNKYGRSEFHSHRSPQSEPFSAYIRKAWQEFVPRVRLDAEYNGRRVTLLRQERLSWSNKLHKAANNDNWFNVWFNSLRTAYGMFLAADESRDGELRAAAEGNLTLALLAPQKGGIAPSIFYLDSSGGHWVADHAWGGIRDGSCYAMFHNAWTCYWLLQWADLLPARAPEILEYSGRFADFLVRNQQPSGVIPSWYDAEHLSPVPELADENAETAGAALFLAEYHRRTGHPKALEAAERAMRYIFSAIVPENKWFDYETFFSCSRKPVGFFDPYTGQHPQNTLSMHQAAEACLVLSQVTGKEVYKEMGVAIVDYLCLYQQVWSPRWLSAELFGGFGVQNTDGEWSDSRQGYFAVTLVKYYELTGAREYFERGIAALRAMFSLFEAPDSPRTAENYAHDAVNRLAGVTGLHWGTGSSVVSIHLIRQRYGDAYVDVGGMWGAGIDGCRISSVVVDQGKIRLQITDTVRSPRTVRLSFGNMEQHEYGVVVNGVDMGSRNIKDLTRGIFVSL